MLDCETCPLDDSDFLEKVAMDAHAASNREAVEAQFLATLSQSQKTLWLDLESAMLHEMNILQKLTIKQTHCTTCKNKLSCTN